MKKSIYFLLLQYIRVFLSISTGATVAISLERSSYTVSENSGFVEVCTILNGLGVVEDAIIVDILTESISATGKPALKVSAR